MEIKLPYRYHQFLLLSNPKAQNTLFELNFARLQFRDSFEADGCWVSCTEITSVSSILYLSHVHQIYYGRSFSIRSKETESDRVMFVIHSIIGSIIIQYIALFKFDSIH